MRKELNKEAGQQLLAESEYLKAAECRFGQEEE